MINSILTETPSAALQSHYALVQAMALDEDEMPEIVDETLPDEVGMARYGRIQNAHTYTDTHTYIHTCMQSGN